MEADVLHEGRAVFSLDLHPAFIGNALEGIRLQLEARLLRWDEGLGGVFLCFRNLQKLPSQVPIRPYFPYLQLTIAADILLFRPSPGAVLCGRVTKIGADFIGMTVLGAINAAVGRHNIRAELQYRRGADMWSSTSDESHNIELGCDVIFTVDTLQIDGNGVVAVLGSLREAWTGDARHAATARPAAFPDASRWQQMQRQVTTLDELLAGPPLRGRDQLEQASRAADKAPLTQAGDAEAVDASPANALTGEEMKQKRKKTKRKLMDGSDTALPMPSVDVAAAGGSRLTAAKGEPGRVTMDPALPAESAALSTKKKRKRARQQEEVANGLHPGTQPLGDGQSPSGDAASADVDQPGPKKKQRKRPASEGVAASEAPAEEAPLLRLQSPSANEVTPGRGEKAKKKKSKKLHREQGSYMAGPSPELSAQQLVQDSGASPERPDQSRRDQSRRKKSKKNLRQTI